MKWLFAVILFFMTYTAGASTIEIDKARGQYVLDMDAVYVLYVNLDIWTFIKFPQGYVVTAIPSGSKDFIKASYIQNRVYVTKSSPENNWVTNLTVHVTTPEGMEKEVVFQCIPKAREKITYGLTFTEPDYTPCNEMVKAIQSKYQTELKGTLDVQKRELDSLLPKTTLIESKAVFIGKPGVLYKGANVTLDGIIENHGNYYLYLHASVNQLDSNAVKCIGIRVKKNVTPADRISTVLTEDRTYHYVYKCPSLNSGRKKAKLVVEIWSKVFEIPVRVL